MPGGGGPGAMNNLRAIGASNQAVIVYSGMPADKQLVWAHDRGLTKARFIQKPFDLFEFTRIVHELCPPPPPEAAAASAVSETRLRACSRCGAPFECADAGVACLCPNCLR
ncbi:MAG: hypothetical protein AAB262_03640 [Elusimicrobiota bacterium]